jgi:hypothetical protein
MDTPDTAKSAIKPLPHGYTIVHEAPDIASYVRIRAESGLTIINEEQARAAVAGTFKFVHVSYEGKPVGMGRVVGDGGWYFMIADMAVLPAHQRLGLVRVSSSGA